MKKFRQLSLLWLSFVSIFIFIACAKQGPALPNKAKSQQGPNEEAALQSVIFNNITSDSSQNHTFSISAITQAVIDSGAVVAYAADASGATGPWHSLPIMNGCGLRLDVAALTEGKVVIQNTLGASVTMSYR